MKEEIEKESVLCFACQWFTELEWATKLVGADNTPVCDFHYFNKMSTPRKKEA